MPAESTLLLGKTLLLFTLWTTTIHLAIAQIIFEKQSTARTFRHSGFMDNRFTTSYRAFKYGLTIVAPVLSLKRFFAVGTLLGHLSTPSYPR